MNKQLATWLKILNDVHYPRWEELPDLDLYMDQVISLLEKYLGFLCTDSKDRVVTNTMINNYVKLKMIPKPKKKRYSKVHLAYLIAILSLKQVLTIKEIKDGIQFQANISGTKEAYNYFCDQIESALKQVLGILDPEYELVENTIIDDPSEIAIKLATRSVASKIVVSYTVLIQQKDEVKYE